MGGGAAALGELVDALEGRQDAGVELRGGGGDGAGAGGEQAIGAQRAGRGERVPGRVGEQGGGEGEGRGGALGGALAGGAQGSEAGVEAGAGA